MKINYFVLTFIILLGVLNAKKELKVKESYEKGLDVKVSNKCRRGPKGPGGDSDSCIRCANPDIEEGAKCEDLNQFCGACKMNLPAKCCPGTCAKCGKKENNRVLQIARDYQQDLNQEVPFECISGYGMYDDDTCIHCTDPTIPKNAKCEDLKHMDCANACKLNLPLTCCPRTCGRCTRKAFKETLKKARDYQDMNQEVPENCAATNGEDSDSCIRCTDPEIEEEAKCSDLNMMGCSDACKFNLPAKCCPGTCSQCGRRTFKETLKKARAYRGNLDMQVPEDCAATNGADSDSCIRCTDPSIEEGAQCAELFPEACSVCKKNMPAKCCPGTCAKCAEQKPSSPGRNSSGRGHRSENSNEDEGNEVNNDQCAQEAFGSPCDAKVMCPYVPMAQMKDIGLLYYCCPQTFEECMMNLALRCFPSEEGVDSDKCVGCMVKQLDKDGNVKQGTQGCAYLGKHCNLCDESLIAMSCCLETCGKCKEGQM